LGFGHHSLSSFALRGRMRELEAEYGEGTKADEKTSFAAD
jgi:hypothetical protein